MDERRARRPLGITIFCALAFVSALVGCFKGLALRDELVAAHPRLAPPVFWLYFAIVPLIAVGAFGLWRMRRWGFFLTLALSAAAIAIDLWAGVEVEHPAAVGGMAAFLLAVTLPRWKLLA